MRRFLLALLTIAIVPVTIVLSITWVTLLTINNPDLIKSTAKKENAYQKITNILPQYISQREDDPIIFSDENKLQIIKSTFPENFMKNNIENISDDFFAWLNGKQKNFKIYMDFATAKDNAKQEITSIYKEKYASLPECTESELVELRLQSQKNFPTCRIPPENSTESRYQTFNSQLVSTDALNSLPDKLEFPLPDNFRRIQKVFNQFKLLLTIVTLADLLFISLAIYLLRPFKKKLFRFLGSILMIAGLALIAFNYFILDILNSELVEKLRYSLSKSTQIKDLVLSIYNQIILDLKTNFHFATLVLIILSIIFLLIGIILKNKPNEPESHP
ncbi:MAG: hypothetical protein Q7S37_04145 [bacterium]|nr:hypothetical protein [bacterium]